MKYALVIGNNQYEDPKLAQLKTPEADSQALARVLEDRNVGGFDRVESLINQTETQTRRAIGSFLRGKEPDDMVLLYFSGHGVLDERGRLFLALKDTQTTLLTVTAISSSFVVDEMDGCRSKRQILILDCCHSGAFTRGTKGTEGEQKAVTQATFEGSGYGRVVLTASDSTQYALEGDQVIKRANLSLFTYFLLEGLTTGKADSNNDGMVTLEEWYDYAYGQVRAQTPNQTPKKWSYNQQGDLIIGKNVHTQSSLPAHLSQALESPITTVREAAIKELGRLLRKRDPDVSALAQKTLETLKVDTDPKVSLAANQLLLDSKRRREIVQKLIHKPLEEATLEPVFPRILLAIINPVIDIKGYKSMSESLHWEDPDELAEKLISELKNVSYGLVEPRIEQRKLLKEFPLLVDGFIYDLDKYDAVLRGAAPAHDPQGIDYDYLLDRLEVTNKIGNDEIDEVWIFGAPYFGLYESIMGGTGAFWCNAPPLKNTASCPRRFVVMGYTFQRQIGNMLHTYNHRCESILAKVFDSEQFLAWAYSGNRSPARIRTNQKLNDFQRFSLFDQIAPGRAAVGLVHFPPNGVVHYDVGNPNPVKSECYDWLQYPDFNGDVRMISCTEWGGGDERSYQRWWLKHIPHADGKTNGVMNNWWFYVADPNNVEVQQSP